MSTLKQAREFIKNYSFPEEVLEYFEEFDDGQFFGSGPFKNGNYTQSFSAFNYKATKDYGTFNHKILAESLGYEIAVSKKKEAESKIKPGASKYAGLPHLPKSMEVPEDYTFIAQINLAEIKHMDLEGYLPETGILYFFFDEDTEGKVLFYDGSHSNIKLLRQEGNAYSLAFKPQLVFNVDDEDGASVSDDVLENMPEELITGVEKMLKCKVSDEVSDFKIFGRPTYWQMEDCDLSKEDLGAEGRRALIHEAVNHVLLFQDASGEGHIQFWISKENLKARAFHKAFLTYSGT